MKLIQMNFLPRAIACAILATAAAVSASAQTVSPVQATADPHSIAIAAPVMEAGSDAASRNFDNTVLPSLTAFVQSALPERQNNTASAAFEVDPNNIILANNTDVRAYFVSEGAGYHNSIGVASQMPSDATPYNSWDQAVAHTSKLLFPDASSTEGGVTDGTGVYGTRTAAEPVLPGDFVDAGTYAKGTKLDFFLLSGGAQNYWANSFSTDGSLNPDGFSQHVAAFTTHLFAVPQLNSPYLFLSFEDQWGGGDQDINDVVIALDVGTATVNALLATPEPAMPLTFAACLGLALIAFRLNKKTATVVS